MKILFSILLIVAVILTIQGQTINSRTVSGITIKEDSRVDHDPAYHPLVLEENRWSVLGWGTGSNHKVCCVETDHLIFQGDTTIEAQTYKRVYTSKDSLGLHQQLSGFIREDVKQKKVWYRNLANKEGLIYDFNVTVGSELTLMNTDIWYENTYFISQIDSMKIGSGYRKVYILRSPKWYTERWIEGIGSTLGIISGNRASFQEGETHYKELICFSNSTTDYMNPNFQTCHKTRFTPLISSTTLDRASVNKPYSFQVKTTEISDFDHLSFVLGGQSIQAGITINQKTGEISGMPTQTGTYSLYISVYNNGYRTDYLETELIVDQNVGNSDINRDKIVQLYPNPSQGVITLEYPKLTEHAILCIYNSEGKLYFHQMVNFHTKTIDVSSFSNGLYLVKIEDSHSKKTIYSKQLIINKH